MPAPAPAPRSVAILRALWLGDLLCAVPVFRALRAAWPDAHIALVGLPWAREFVDRFDGYLDELIEMPGVPGSAEERGDQAGADGFLERMQQRSVDLAIQLQGDGRLSNAFVARWGAKRIAGFHWPGYPAPDPATFVTYRDEGHETSRLLRLLPALGVPGCGDRLELPLRGADADVLQAIPEARPVLDGSYVVIHPGSRGEDRQWAPAEFARIADVLARRGLRVVLTGSAPESQLTTAVAQRMTAAVPVDLAGRTGLGALAALVARARLVVCNDTGISHVADALEVPSVVVSLDRETTRWAPRNARLHPFVDVAGGATADDVMAAALRLLRDPGTARRDVGGTRADIAQPAAGALV